MMGVKPELVAFDKDPAAYDLLVIGTPVWAWTFTPAIRSFFAQAALKDKKIALFCTHEGSPGKTLEHMEKKLGGNEIVSKAGFLAPVEKDKETIVKQATDWARDIKRQGGIAK